MALLALLLAVVSNASPTFAEQAMNRPYSRVNEYEVLKNIRALTDDELMAQGYTIEQIEEVRTIDYAAHIREIAKLDDNTLRRVRYTDEQIGMLRKFDGSEEQMQLLSASLYLWAGYEDWHYETNPQYNSWVKMWASWAWAGVPGGTFTDRLIFAWSHDFRLDRSALVTHANINYYYESVYGYWASETVAPSPDASTPGSDTSAAEFKISMRKAINGLWCRALDGTAKIRVSDPGPEDSINLFVSYGHRPSIIALEPGWSIFGGVDVSVEWSNFWTYWPIDGGNLNIYTGTVTYR